MDFHDKSFDDATQLKLELFRKHIREWLPVFLTKRNYDVLNIFDFFAGPGRDATGNPGSPVIIVDELKRFCQEHESLKPNGIDVRLLFNDTSKSHIEKLRNEIREVACPEGCCRTEYTSLPFKDTLQQWLPVIRHPKTANLIIMDQFGVKEVTPDIIRQLAECRTTDILFFISSSFVRRFIKTPEFGEKFDINPDDIENVDNNDVHRYICEYYREKIGGMEYYLAPFSIKKGRNIHGVIFGTGHLLGLEKFLKVCWKKDSITGEANYNIDGDVSYGGQRSLFPEDNVIRKVGVFNQDLEKFVKDRSPDNKDVYKFCLTHGFLPKHANEAFRLMQKEERLMVTEIETGKPARRGAFYLPDGYKKNSPKVKFGMRSG